MRRFTLHRVFNGDTIKRRVTVFLWLQVVTEELTQHFQSNTLHLMPTFQYRKVLFTLSILILNTK